MVRFHASEPRQSGLVQYRRWMEIYLRDINYENVWGKGNDQNLYGYHHPRGDMNLVSEGDGSCQSLATNEQVLNPNAMGFDSNYWRAHGGFNSISMPRNLLLDLELNLTLLIFLRL